MLRKILIVDDNTINRRLLRKMLSDEYEVLEAENGKEAVDILFKKHKVISAVLLDLVMPVMDGYQVLTHLRSNPALSQLPVIVTTGSTEEGAEVKALSLGANDYITKPYNPSVIKHRLRNTIKLRETAATVNALQRDRLTGLYNREAFFDHAAVMIAAHAPGFYVMTCFDINGFKIINDQYGSQKGDELLRHIANIFREGFGAIGGVCCRVMADNFAVLYPTAFMDSPEIAEIHRQAMRPYGVIRPLTYSIGRYIIDDLKLSVSAMYDRATMAKAAVKGRYDVHIGLYDESMRERLLREQQIVTEMNGALATGQFEMWLQPQYNHASGALIGAEALVRWRHPKHGLITPNEFIPVFERNGFIYEMDKHIWEQACAFLRKWLDAGRAPLPVSVNISRYDIFRSNLIEVITELIEKYRLPVGLLRLEITESAFAESTDQIINVIKRLLDIGFSIEIDDFGSGYSSLNTLKDVPADILKLDMRFLTSNENSQRGGNILESIVRMAKWLGMSVIAEGVETPAQADYLQSIGCNYVQGYLYARPMPVKQYEALAAGIAKEEKLRALEAVENLDNNAFWDPASMDTLIFNSYVGGACIFEYHNGKAELLRANEKYAREIVGESAPQSALSVRLADYLDAQNRAEMQRAIDRAAETNEEASCEVRLSGLPGGSDDGSVLVTVRVIARTGNRLLFYGTARNTTAQRRVEQRERDTAAKLQAIMDNVNCGVSAATFSDGGFHYLFANDEYYSMFGYTKAQFEKELPHGLIDRVRPEDRQTVLDATAATFDSGIARINYRVRKRDGSEIWVHSNSSTCRMEGVAEPVRIAVITDITKNKEAEQQIRTLNENLTNMMNDIPGGFVRFQVLPGNIITNMFANDGFCHMLGMSLSDILTRYRTDSLWNAHPDDIAAVRAAISDMLAYGGTRSITYRLRRADGEFVPFRVFGRLTENENGERFLNLYYADLPEQEKHAAAGK